MEIKIEHIAKIEGHAGFVADIVRGDVEKAKIEIKQGKRFLEKILQGRSFADAPVICSRICGICPVVHQITCLKAIENAFSIKPGPEIVNLRKIMLAGQMIQSHALHLFFLSMNRELLAVRNFGNQLIEIIGGRSVHSITPKVGGFERFPEKKKIENLMAKYKNTLKLALKIAPQFKKQPEFLRKTEFFASSDIYEGKLSQKKGRIYMLGALARINLYADKLNPKAKKLLSFEAPCYNPFLNIFSQAVEIVHFLEEVKKTVDRLKFKEEHTDYQIKAGRGRAFCEAPRGTLFHSYIIDERGFVKKAEILTPTLQFIPNLEQDLQEYVGRTKDKEKIKSLIRAYDPCISCAVR